MNRGSTIFLRAVILLIGLAVLTFCVFSFPIMWRSENLDYLPVFLVVQLSAIPLFFALYQAIKLLNHIDQNKAFSELSVKSLKYIKYCAFAFGGLYILGMPYIYYKGDVDDAPGPIAISLILIFVAIVAAAFAAVLEKLVRNGLDLKAENDLTV